MTAAVTATSTLPPEALELIKQGAPKPIQEKQPIPEKPTLSVIAPTIVPATKAEPEAVPVESLKAEKRPKPARAAQAQQVEEVVHLQESYRLPQPLLRQLSRACFDRKSARARPFTRQGIVALALEDWLKKEGYFGIPTNS